METHYFVFMRVRNCVQWEAPCFPTTTKRLYYMLYRDYDLYYGAVLSMINYESSYTHPRTLPISDFLRGNPVEWGRV